MHISFWMAVMRRIRIPQAEENNICIETFQIKPDIGNIFNASVWPQGYTQCIVWSFHLFLTFKL